MPGTLINLQELRRQCQLNGTEKTASQLVELLKKKKLTPQDFSIRDLAEAFLGEEFIRSLNPKSGRAVNLRLLEAVAYSDFSNITGQIVFSAILQGFEDQEFVFTKQIDSVPTDIQDMEKIPGISNIGDEEEEVLEGNAYPFAGVSEDYIEVAAKKKKGFIIQVTKEAIRGDKTGLLLDRCKKRGKYAGLSLEKAVIDAIIDENAGAKSAALGGHRYHWKGTSYATYQTSTPWINVTASNALVDYTDVDAARRTMLAIDDPYTGEPVTITARDIVVTPQNEFAAWRILNATETRTHAGGYPVTGNPEEFAAGNPLQGRGYRVLSSQLLADRAATDTDWWLCNLKEGVKRFYNWDIEEEEAAPNHPDAFLRDILMQFKVSRKDIVSVIEPRVLHESRA